MSYTPCRPTIVINTSQCVLLVLEKKLEVVTVQDVKDLSQHVTQKMNHFKFWIIVLYAKRTGAASVLITTIRNLCQAVSNVIVSHVMIVLLTQIFV